MLPFLLILTTLAVTFLVSVQAMDRWKTRRAVGPQNKDTSCTGLDSDNASNTVDASGKEQKNRG